MRVLPALRAWSAGGRGGACTATASPTTATRDLLALGLHLTKVPEIMLIVVPPGSIDEDFAHKPSIIYANDTLYQFYCCVSGKWPQDDRAISVARSRPWPEARE
jgi:hypothetical protein